MEGGHAILPRRGFFQKRTVLMLFLTENETIPTLKRFHNEIASALFYTHVGSNRGPAAAWAAGA